MRKESYDIPVVLIIYKRPELTKLVVNEIAKVQPTKLFIIADGPSTPLDKTNCEKTIEVVEDSINWPCLVEKNYSSVNLGCKQRIFSGLNWVFSKVDKAVILEDDCVPTITFFYFCKQLLNMYEKDQRVYSISGTQYQNEINFCPFSYYFSHYFHCWGWATWKRVWDVLDYEMTNWNYLKSIKFLKSIFPHDIVSQNDWEVIFDDTFNNRNSSWAYRMSLQSFITNSLNIVPSKNLIKNIGFNEDSTHTNKGNQLKLPPVAELEFPLKHPLLFLRSIEADKVVQEKLYRLGGRRYKLNVVFKNFIKNIR